MQTKCASRRALERVKHIRHPPAHFCVRHLGLLFETHYEKDDVKTVSRALGLLSAVAQRGSSLTLQEIAEMQKLPLSTAHRLVAVMQAEGYLVRAKRTRLYSLGPAVRALITQTSSDFIRRIAEPTVRRLNIETQETVILVEFIGSDAICFNIREGRRALRLYVELGSKMPLHASASARVLLADLDDQAARLMLGARVPLEKWTERTITDIEEIVSHLDLVRAQGYDICDDEMENSTWAVAAPIRDFSGSVLASICVVVPLRSMEGDNEERQNLTDAVVLAAREISQELGAVAPFQIDDRP